MQRLVTDGNGSIRLESGAPAEVETIEQPAGIGHKLHAYFALTKPRIIELLLVTTVPAMVVAAGDLAVDVAGHRDAHRGDLVGGRCQRDQLLHRPRHRPGHATNETATAADAPDRSTQRTDLRLCARRDRGRVALR